jgi:hypothetical protein
MVSSRGFVCRSSRPRCRGKLVWIFKLPRPPLTRRTARRRDSLEWEEKREKEMMMDLLSQALLARWRLNDGWPCCCEALRNGELRAPGVRERNNVRGGILGWLRCQRRLLLLRRSRGGHEGMLTTHGTGRLGEGQAWNRWESRGLDRGSGTSRPVAASAAWPGLTLGNAACGQRQRHRRAPRS